MLAQVLEYVDCLSIIGGKGWLLDDSILATLSSTDLTLLQLDFTRQISNDLTLAQLLYGSSATVDGRYRRRIARFEDRLAEIALSCPLSPYDGF